MGWLKCLSLLGCALVLVNPSCHGDVWTEEDEARALQQGEGRLIQAALGSSLNTPDALEEERARQQGREEVRGRQQSQGRFPQDSRYFGDSNPQLVNLGQKEESISQLDRRRQYGEGRVLQRNTGRGLQYGEGRDLQYGEGRGLQYGEGRVLQRNRGRLQSLQTPYTQYQGRFPQNGAEFPQNEGRYPQNEGRYPQNEGRYPQNEGRYSQNEGRYQQGGSGSYPRYEDGQGQYETLYDDVRIQDDVSEAAEAQLDSRAQEPNVNPSKIQLDENVESTETAGKRRISFDFLENAVEQKSSEKECLSCHFLDGKNPAEQEVDNRKAEAAKSETGYLQDTLNFVSGFFQGEKPAPTRQEYLPRNPESRNPKFETPDFNGRTFERNQDGLRPHVEYRSNVSPDFNARHEYLLKKFNGQPEDLNGRQEAENDGRQTDVKEDGRIDSFDNEEFNARHEYLLKFGKTQPREFSSSNNGKNLDGRQEAENDGRQTDVNEDGWIDSFDSEEEYLKYRLQQLEKTSDSTGHREAGYEEVGQNQPIDASASRNDRLSSQRDRTDARHEYLLKFGETQPQEFSSSNSGQNLNGRTEPVQGDAELDYLEYRREQQYDDLAQNNQLNLDNGRFGQNDRPNSRFGEQNQGGHINYAQSEYLKYRQEQFYDDLGENVQQNLNEKSRSGEQNQDTDAQSEYLKYREEQFFNDRRQNVQPNLNENSRFGEQNQDGRTKGDAQSEYLKYRQEQLYDSQFYDNPVQDVQSNQVEENARFGDLDQGIFDIYHPEEAEQLDYLEYRRTGDGSKAGSGFDAARGFESPTRNQLEYSQTQRSPQTSNFGQESRPFGNSRQTAYEAPPQKTEAELAYEAHRLEAELAFKTAEERRQAALEAEKARLKAAKEAFEEEINRLRSQGCSSCGLVLKDAALHEGNAELLDLEKKQKKPLKVSKLMDLEDDSVEAPRAVKSPRDGCVTCHLIQPPTPQPAPILEGAQRTQGGHLKVPILVEVDNAGKTTPLQKRDPSGALDLRKAASFRASTFMETKEDRPFIPRSESAPTRRGRGRGSSGNERPHNSAQRRLRPKAVRPRVRGCRSCHVLQ